VAKTGDAETNEAKEKGGVAALERAVLILSVFRAEDKDLSLAEIAARTGIYKSTIMRLCTSLIRGGLLIKLESGHYKIGPEALRLGTIYQLNLDLGEVLLPLMRELMAETQESVLFYVREGNQRVCLYRVESPQKLRFNVRVGDMLPLDRGSPGRVMLAFSGVRGELYDEVRRNYLHISNGDRDPDTGGLGAPVFGPRQNLLGVIAVTGPISRLNLKAAERIAPSLLLAAARATQNFGGDPAGLRQAYQNLAAQSS
jgi:DNA-binding IclR family transcriptional regulator